MEKGIRFSGPDIFNEELYPLESTKTKRYRKAVTDPDVEVLYSFITKIVDRVDLEETCIVLSLAFVERVMVFRQFDLLPSNWRRMIITAFMVAAKTFYDEVVWNADFVTSFPNYDIASSLHQMEMCMLEMIDFNVIVRQALYAKYYFELRSISEEQNYNTLKKRYREERVRASEGWDRKQMTAADQAGSLITSGGRLADLSLSGVPKAKEQSHPPAQHQQQFTGSDMVGRGMGVSLHTGLSVGMKHNPSALRRTSLPGEAKTGDML